MPCIVPNMSTKILRGEKPDIVEVPHDPYRGWLEPEFETEWQAESAWVELGWGFLGAFPQNPNRETLKNLLLDYASPWND